MIQSIDRDYNRFRKIVKGTIRKNLKKLITGGDLLGRQGKKTVKIPLPQIEIPRFKFGKNSQGGVGQGDGEVGDVLGAEPQPGQGEAGDKPGEHTIDADITFEELAEMLGEELALPRIEPKGKKTLKTIKDKYTGIRTVGPNSLLSFKRTYKESLKRQVASGNYDFDDPVIMPINKDRRFRSWNEVAIPENAAVIIYIMDVSGSMGEEQKEIVRLESFWLDTWLQHNYDGIETRYIIHDATAKEVDQHTFFHTRESGGTLISSAYKLSVEILEKNYNFDEWNVYIFHFSDGDNWSGEDTQVCMKILKEKLLKISNVFCYGQVESRYGSGQFLKDLETEFPSSDDIILSQINSKDDIYSSIRDFLGTGR